VICLPFCRPSALRRSGKPDSGAHGRAQPEDRPSGVAHDTTEELCRTQYFFRAQQPQAPHKESYKGEHMTIRAIPAIAFLVVSQLAFANTPIQVPRPSSQIDTSLLSRSPMANVADMYASAWNMGNLDNANNENRNNPDKPKKEDKKPKPIHGDEMSLGVAILSGACVLSGYFLISRMRKRRRA